MQTIQTAEEARQRGQYLRALVLLEGVVREASGLAQVESYARQTLGFVQADVGASREALESFAVLGQTSQPDLAPAEQTRVSGARLVNAVEAIARASRGRQVVILNEAHHVPQGREFARRLALAMRREGFSSFAAETFSPGIASTAPGYATQNSGYYTADPVYGELVRSALGAGYRLVPYEAETFRQDGTDAERINDRERQQAENLVNRIFKGDPTARVFIYVGYAHNLEEPQTRQGETLKWMALRLRELTGLDPLTIDQTEGLSRGEARLDSPVRRAVIALKHPQTASVLQDAQGQPLKVTPFQPNDLQVFHPDPVLIAGRPQWLYGAGRVTTHVHVPAWTGGGRRLVQAFHAGERADAVPADQVLIHAGGEVTLLLMPGKYRLVTQDELGKTIPVGNVTVK